LLQTITAEVVVTEFSSKRGDGTAKPVKTVKFLEKNKQSVPKNKSA